MKTSTFEQYIHIHIRKEDCAFLTIKDKSNDVLRAKVLRSGYSMSVIESKKEDQHFVTYFIVDYQKLGNLKATARAYALELNATLVYVQAKSDFSLIKQEVEKCLGVLDYGREKFKSISLCDKKFESAKLLAMITQVTKAELVYWQSSNHIFRQLPKAEAYSVAMFARLALTDNPSRN